MGSYRLNGGARGRDFLVRYFSISAVVALWIAVPFQALLALPQYAGTLARADWYNPFVVLVTNALIFAFIASQIWAVAKRSVVHEAPVA